MSHTVPAGYVNEMLPQSCATRFDNWVRRRYGHIDLPTFLAFASVGLVAAWATFRFCHENYRITKGRAQLIGATTCLIYEAAVVGLLTLKTTPIEDQKAIIEFLERQAQDPKNCELVASSVSTIVPLTSEHTMRLLNLSQRLTQPEQPLPSSPPPQLKLDSPRPSRIRAEDKPNVPASPRTPRPAQPLVSRNTHTQALVSHNTHAQILGDYFLTHLCEAQGRYKVRTPDNIVSVLSPSDPMRLRREMATYLKGIDLGSTLLLPLWAATADLWDYHAARLPRLPRDNSQVRRTMWMEEAQKTAPKLLPDTKAQTCPEIQWHPIYNYYIHTMCVLAHELSMHKSPDRFSLDFASRLGYILESEIGCPKGSCGRFQGPQAAEIAHTFHRMAHIANQQPDPIYAMRQALLAPSQHPFMGANIGIGNLQKHGSWYSPSTMIGWYVRYKQRAVFIKRLDTDVIPSIERLLKGETIEDLALVGSLHAWLLQLTRRRHIEQQLLDKITAHPRQDHPSKDGVEVKKIIPQGAKERIDLMQDPHGRWWRLDSKKPSHS